MTKKIFANYCVITLFAFSLAVRPVQAISSQDAPLPLPVSQTQGVDSRDLGKQPVEVRLDPTFLNYRAAPPMPRTVLSNQAALMLADSFTIEYVPNGERNHFEDLCTTFPEVAKPAVEYAASIWASQLNPSVPIKIQVCWSDMAPGVLGHSGPVKMYDNFSNASVKNTWYPVALANEQSGTDLNGPEAEMSIAYNSYYLNTFYYGTDFFTPYNQVNFATVVLHEITHGLGFLGLMGYSTADNEGYWGSGLEDSYPMIYDRFAVDESGNSLINTALYPNPSFQLGTELTSENVYFNGANARLANGGTNAKLYAPATWKPGSSYAHLDYVTYYGTINSLMTYAVTYGSTNYDPGPVTLGILTDVGWPFPPTAISLSNASVEAAKPAGTTIGTFTTTDPNTPETFTYSLVAGGADNSSFAISGNTLRTKTVFTREGTKTIRVRSTDRNGLYFEMDFTIHITSPNHPPTDIRLSKSSLAENQPADSYIGTLSSMDPDAGSTFTYSLVSTSSCPGTDNAYFNISGTSLRTSSPLNFETQPNYTICVRSTDQTALAYDKAFTISLTNVNEAATEIQLSRNWLQVNASQGEIVALLTANDPDAGDALTYTMKGGCYDNNMFTLDNNILYLAQPVTRAIGETYLIQVNVVDAGSLGVTQTLTLEVVKKHFLYVPELYSQPEVSPFLP